MATLLFETSTPTASLALAGESEGLLCERSFAAGRSHNAVLFAPLREMLAAAAPLERVLVGSGPGSYSGTRVGIAAAQGVAMAQGVEAVALPSLCGLPAAGESGGCLVIGDARRGSYWCAELRGRLPEGDPELLDAAGLGKRVAAALQQGRKLVTLEMPAAGYPLAAEMAGRVRLEIPSAALLWQAWLAATAAMRRRWASVPPQPLYLKPPHITAAKPRFPAR